MKEKKVEETKKVAEENALPQDIICESGNEQGVVRIHENVIVSVVRAATCSVDGVVRLAGNSIVDNIADIVGSRKISDRSIKVNLEGPRVEIEVEIIIAYDTHIPTVASGVQTKIIEDVENITGMAVSKVDVIIQGLSSYPTTEEKN